MPHERPDPPTTGHTKLSSELKAEGVSGAQINKTTEIEIQAER